MRSNCFRLQRGPGMAQSAVDVHRSMLSVQYPDRSPERGVAKAQMLCPSGGRKRNVGARAWKAGMSCCDSLHRLATVCQLAGWSRTGMTNSDGALQARAVC